MVETYSVLCPNRYKMSSWPHHEVECWGQHLPDSKSSLRFYPRSSHAHLKQPSHLNYAKRTFFHTSHLAKTPLLLPFNISFEWISKSGPPSSGILSPDGLWLFQDKAPEFLMWAKIHPAIFKMFGGWFKLLCVCVSSQLGVQEQLWNKSKLENRFYQKRKEIIILGFTRNEHS